MPLGNDNIVGIVPVSEVTSTVILTIALGARVDLGVYPNNLARVTTLPLICAESRNASFKAKCAVMAL